MDGPDLLQRCVFTSKKGKSRKNSGKGGVQREEKEETGGKRGREKIEKN